MTTRNTNRNVNNARARPGSGANRDQQKEVRELHDKSTKVTSETVSKTRDLLRLVNECKDSGVNTLNELQSQGEQLSRTEEALDETDHQLARAEVNLKNIETGNDVCCCCLPCVSCCQKDTDKMVRKNKKKSKVITLKDSEKTAEAVSRTKMNVKGGKGDANRNDQERFFPKILGTPEEDEIERNLDHVSLHLSHLKVIATDMNTEVDRQNEQIDRMNNKSEKSLGRVNAATQRATDLVNDKKPSPRKCCCCCSIA